MATGGDHFERYVSAGHVGEINMGSGAAPQGGRLRRDRLLYRRSQPRVPSYFTARDEELKRLEAVDGPSVVVALRGIGGVGKTQLASRFFDEHQCDYDIAIWADAELDDGLADLGNAARRAGLAEIDGESPADFANRLWDEITAAKRRLLVVFDNASSLDAVRDLLPRAGSGRVIITSRYRYWDGLATPVEVGVLGEADGASLLRTVSGRTNDPGAEDLCGMLGGLPLALVLAASRCRHGRSLGDFGERWRARPDFADLAAGTDDAYTRTVHAIWRDSLAEATRRAPTAPDLLGVLAGLDWRAVSRRWLLDGLEAYGQLGDGDELRDALEVLADLSLVVLDDDRIAVQHSLIVEGVLTEERPRVGPALTELLGQALVGDPASAWGPSAEEAVGHLHARASFARTTTPELLDVANRGLLFLLRRGEHQRGVTIAERLVSDRERLGLDHPDTLRARANLAASYLSAGRTAEAIVIGEQVVADRERLLGADHPDTVLARANLAASYHSAGRTAEAIVIGEQVVADRERVLGPDHPDTVTARANLAASYHSAGRTAEAMAIGEQVVADRERLLGRDHPDTITARANLAASYWSAGRTAEAMAIDEQVVADRERLLGSDHPATLRARANLAASYRSSGRTAEALAIGEQVVVDCERLLGSDHPDTLTARANLAASYHSAGRTAEALAIGEQVVVDCERLLGSDHPDTLTARANLASSYHSAGRTAEALAIGEQVVVDCERVLGPDHPDTLTARANLAASYWSAGRTAEAMAIEEQVVVDRERLLGPDHPDTVRAQETLARWREEPEPDA